MAKWSMDYPGQSGHYHLSLNDADQVNQFFDASCDDGVSAMQRFAVGGLNEYLPEFLALVAPTINSYTRLVKGAWAPTAATWGIENRTAATRVIPGNDSSQRIECRVGGADGNPYLVAAAILAAALRGIREEIEPGDPVTGNAYDAEDDLPSARKFPSNLAAAAQRLDQSAAARECFGDEFVDHFVMSRRWEVAEYEKSLNSWQLERYFEII
jgi:glutamine synthetase